MSDPWANRHPEWAQLEAAQIRAAERRAIRRLWLGLALLFVVAIVGLAFA